VPHQGTAARDDFPDRARRRLRNLTFGWTTAGVCIGALASAGVVIHPDPASTLGAMAGFVTGAAAGVPGLLAVGAGAAVTYELGQALAGASARTVELGVILVPLLSGLVATLMSAFLLLGAGARRIVLRRSAER
jgi:hypothetical protein